MSSTKTASNTTAPTQFLQVKAIPTRTGGSAMALGYRCSACSISPGRSTTGIPR